MIYRKSVIAKMISQRTCSGFICNSCPLQERRDLCTGGSDKEFPWDALEYLTSLISEEIKNLKSRFTLSMLVPDGTFVEVSDKCTSFSKEIRRYAFTLHTDTKTMHYCYVSASKNPSGFDRDMVAPWDTIRLDTSPKKTPEYTMEDLIKLVGHEFKIKKG